MRNKNGFKKWLAVVLAFVLAVGMAFSWLVTLTN